MPTRRTAIATALALIAAPALGAVPSPLFVAIRRARLADAAHRQAARDTLDVFGSNGPRPAYWHAYRFGVMAERYSARRALYALTPATADEASALVAYYAERASLTGNPETARAARRRLRKVFARPGAAPAPALPPALKPPAPS
ncbi:penicillin-binding protein [Methylorubrum podarium]|uniref:Penicillin-binding protein n=1 Tax=Methylorubrum podarium TaxID=200476 RepID=A0ABV1QND2_9HYPH